LSIELFLGLIQPLGFAGLSQVMQASQFHKI